jgi:hypothetical protein
MPQYIPTYPRLQLGDLTGLVGELQLDAKSRFDHWNGHTWDTISISSIIHVESDYPTLLKLRRRSHALSKPISKSLRKAQKL